MHINDFPVFTPQTNAIPSEKLKDIEKAHILNVLRDSNWKISGVKGAASKLDIPPSTLRDKIKKLKIEKP